MSKKVKIVTDSTLDIPKEAIEELGITIVPLSVTVDGKSYLDGVDVTSSEFVKLLVNSKDIPQSSQPSAGSFLEVYDELGKDGSSIISIHMTSGMSGTVASARTAADMTEADVTVVDSQFISIALSFQVKEAARLANEGKNVEEIIERLNDVRKNSSLYIMVDTLEYLLKGGRIGRGRALVGSLLKIKPIASLEDGVYTPVTKVRTHLQMINFMKKKFQEEAAGKIVKGIGIAQVEAQDLARQVKEAIKEVSGFEDIAIIETTPIVSTHTGPGALALMYYFDEK
ncbi:DegV family protein [Salipaludibacillus agaradhaerens]|uniref:DegV family protein n=1 Tax=Salipaludibacillus agaradhaerens TaxID=76935 RepID=UPI002151B114|nr:DegV family protein [Salipaludibacillus agaradhaerens]MCR6118684.1 DegV family protein [Salipaludibacillus agaradhaerens]UJW57765.1 DegV family protein [Bacillus sp. A116_S68]